VPVLLLALLAAAPMPASAQPRAPVLVVLREQADLSGAARIADRLERRRFVYESLVALAERTQAPLRRVLEARGVRFRSHFLVNMLEVEADPETSADLAARADVLRVAANRPWNPIGPVAGPRAAEAAEEAESIEPNVSLVGAPELWELGVSGQGIVIGIADTGFDWEHPALQAHYRGWDGVAAVHDYNWHDAVHDAAAGNACGSDTTAPCDDHGHGTGVAGFAAGETTGVSIGVAPGAKLIGCRNMAAGSGTPARYTECFEWFLAPTDSHGQNPRPDLGPDVINNSWVCPVSEGCADPDVFEGVIGAIRAAGIAATFAAGNRGSHCSTLAEAPAVGASAFTIGATNLDDTIASFSAFGPVTSDGSGRLKPDLSAPGVNLRTSGLGGSYFRFSGTSAAAPHVAGAIALLWSSIPALRGDVDATEELLERSAVPLTTDVDCGGFSGSEVPNPVFGWGRLDIPHAYALAPGREAPVLAPDGRATRTLPARP
jgi:subtilisin family serine protease